MAKRHIHIVGAGLAGLSSALQLTLAGEAVTLYEAAPFAGGRCRSFIDRELDCRIDNGNHLVLSGNTAIYDYLFLTNALDTMGGPDSPIFPFADMETGERWIVRMNAGRWPGWIFDKNRRVLGTKPADYLSGFGILTADNLDTVADKLDRANPLYRRFWEPLVIGALNTEPELASAKLLASICAQTFFAGGQACIPLIPKIGLSETFVLPCLDLLQKKGAVFKYNHRLRGIDMADTHQARPDIRKLHFGNDTLIDIAPEDWVILALPAWFVRELLPEILAPTDFRSIISAHFRVEVPNNIAGFTGLIGSYSEWAFVRNGVVSVTISCAERYKSIPTRDMAFLIWKDLAKFYDLDAEKVPPHRIFMERYATFAATPEQNLRRPTAFTRWKNLALAGEWTATGLPSTIEGAIRSGLKAAQVVMRWS